MKYGKKSWSLVGIGLAAAMSLTACSSLTGSGEASTVSSSTQVIESSINYEQSSNNTSQESNKTSQESSQTSQETQMQESSQTSQETQTQESSQSAQESSSSQSESSQSNSSLNTEEIVTVANTTSDGAIDATDLFSNRDLTQTADLSEAVYYTVSDGQDITITAAGVYVLTGSASEVTVIVEAGDEDKVQLVLDSLSITNSDNPCIYVKSADKVFVTSTDSENDLSVTGTFTADGDTNTDAVIFSKDDLVLNGLGTVTIKSTDNAITSKDDLKVTGGTWVIDCESDALEANDLIRICDGIITINSCNDGLHSENDDDYTLGYIYICGGTITIDADDDAIHGTTIVQIDGGTININAAEGIEGTWVQINGGEISIYSWDDGINAANKSSAYSVCAEFNGGDITISMAQGDTDAIDSNGNLVVNGGTITISAQFAFDFDGYAQYNGGTLIVNGQQVYSITNSMMGGGQGGFGGGQGGPGGFGGGFGGH
ncbi:MAG: carbohydrate-binding domain-containing protein [Firmicutes bacterium]|nr:carbohydrate-binding domain-containing protein [Bacillota bacterium]